MKRPGLLEENMPGGCAAVCSRLIAGRIADGRDSEGNRCPTTTPTANAAIPMTQVNKKGRAVMPFRFWLFISQVGLCEKRFSKDTLRGSRLPPPTKNSRGLYRAITAPPPKGLLPWP